VAATDETVQERRPGTVLVTGGASGLGAAVALAVKRAGGRPYLRDLAAETAGRVGVTLLIPGGMHTAFFDGRPEQYKPSADAKLNRPEDVAQAVLFALCQPPGCEARELMVSPSTESSWP
jgi:NADP-dependent 3-hydroxy acid dehydrogenase YdfG